MSPHSLAFFSIMRRPPPRSTLFPYTTLFRSLDVVRGPHHAHRNQSAGRVGDCERSGKDPYADPVAVAAAHRPDRKSTRLNSSHMSISYAVFCLKKKSASSVLVWGTIADASRR